MISPALGTANDARTSTPFANVTGTLTCAPHNATFGKVLLGQKKSRDITLRNSGDSPIAISQAVVVGAGFSVTALPLPVMMPGGSTFRFQAAFEPQSNGATEGTIYLLSTAAKPVLTIALVGVGTDAGQLMMAPATINFGNVSVGSSQPETGTLAAVGAQITIASGTINNAEFRLSGISFPVTIPAGESVAFTVTFTPQNSGLASGSLTLTSDASNSPTIESLTGSGTPGAGYIVDLSWTASSSQDVMGYNIYRSNTSGGPYSRINSALDSSTVYTDNSVSGGQTYYYVTTAVNSDGEESADSNQAQAVIP